MELIEILRHSGRPRTEYFVELPGPVGKLRLDIYSPVALALAQGTMSVQDLEVCKAEVAESATELNNGNAQAALARLLDLVKRYPYYAPAYGALTDAYSRTGNTGEAEYNFKQLLALDTSFVNIMLFARFLGRNDRLEEARLLQAYLWVERTKAPRGVALEAVHDYLVTLSRIPEPGVMIAICKQAIAEYGSETTLVYQWIYAYLLDGQRERAAAMLDDVLPKLSPADSLLPRFEELRRVAGAMPAD